MDKSQRLKLQEYLSSLVDRVYFQRAPEEATFPYVVYDFSSADVSGEYETDMFVDVEVWDMPADGSTETVEDLIETADLDKKVLALDGDYAVFNLNAKVYTEDSDKRIKRRLYTYLVKIIERR